MPVYDPHLWDDRMTCFLDDSSLDSKSDEHAVLGGIAFNPSGLVAFDEHWTTLMHRFGVEQPFHMRDLSRGERLAHITGCRRWCLLAEVTAAIKFFNLYTVTISLNNRDHVNLFGARLQAAMRVYRLAFFAVVVTNAKAAPAVNYPGRVAYVLDRGTRHSEQVMESHESVSRLDVDNEYRLGPLTFESDTFSTHLQAADVVAWTKRRLTAGKPLVQDFEVLKQLFENNHTEAPITPDILRGMDEYFSPHLTDEGWSEEPPSF
jgi:hypothetical protein